MVMRDIGNGSGNCLYPENNHNFPALTELCYGSSPTYEEFCRILDKTLSIIAPDEINASLHTHIFVENGYPLA